MDDMYDVVGWGVKEEKGSFVKTTFKRNKPGDNDVTLAIKFCGVCHSDIHCVKNELGNLGTTLYPTVPGHESVGLVKEVGQNVKGFKEGDIVGIGGISDCCFTCHSCREGEEQYCENGVTGTENFWIKHGHLRTNTGYTMGGFSNLQTVHERFLIKIPDGIPMTSACPLLCSGVTMYSPLIHWKADNGNLNIGIVGSGSLARIGIQLAKAMANHVTVIDDTPRFQHDANVLGADKYVVSGNPMSMNTAVNSLDLVLNTELHDHSINSYLPLLRRDGTIVQIGLVASEHKINPMSLMAKRLKISASFIGGIAETQACVDFCRQLDIIPQVKLITADALTNTFKTSEIEQNHAKYVLDIEASL